MLTPAELERRAYICGDVRNAVLLASLAEAEDHNNLKKIHKNITSLVGEALDNGLADIPGDIPDYLDSIADDLREQIDALDRAGMDTSDLTSLADRVAEEARDLRDALGYIREWLDKAADRLSGAPE